MKKRRCLTRKFLVVLALLLTSIGTAVVQTSSQFSGRDVYPFPLEDQDSYMLPMMMAPVAPLAPIAAAIPAQVPPIPLPAPTPIPQAINLQLPSAPQVPA